MDTAKNIIYYLTVSAGKGVGLCKENETLDKDK